MRKFLFPFLLFSLFQAPFLSAQNSDLGGWYMYFGNVPLKDKNFSIHGEVQYRNHQVIGDLEQLLIRTGLQYHLKDKAATFTLGYGNITSQAEDKPNNTVKENRIYQEAFLRQKIGKVSLNHRFRYEQRMVENQDFRTRYRYALFLTVPISKMGENKQHWYTALYSEIFVNGQKQNRFEYFDRNRVYTALGYRLNPHLAMQLGYMTQYLNSRKKGQLQLSFHHNI